MPAPFPPPPSSTPFPHGNIYANREKVPQTWLLMGHKAGDNNQVLALAEALGWPYESKHMVYRKSELLSNLLLGPTLAGIKQHESTPLAPPWPDLVITAGRRNEPVARWIRQQSHGQTRLVHLGRPWAPLAQFDLIVTTPQYCLPQATNILHNMLPLHRITEQRLASAARAWTDRLSHLPHPFIALLVGGNSGPFTLNDIKIRTLARSADALAKRCGGSLLVTSSARTPLHAMPALRDLIQSPAYYHCWSANDKDNPYFAFLALADAFIVTGDSVSMVCEACETGKPVYIFDLADDPGAHRPPAPGDRLPWWRYGYNFRLRPLSHRLAMWLGPKRMRREVRGLHERLIQAGRAAWLGEPLGENDSAPQDDLTRTVQRVKGMFRTEPRHMARPVSPHVQ